MLTHEIMGLLALGVLWVNTLLVVGAALGQMGSLLGHLKTLRTLRRGVVHRGDADGVLARFEVEQTGHKAADDRDRQAILFHDRGCRSVVPGGAIEIDGETHALMDTEVDVWVEASALREAARCPDIAAFDAAFAKAKKAKGFRRTVVAALREGDEVWVAGTTSSPKLLASFDPRGLLRGKVLFLAAFCVAMTGLSAAATYLALWPPYFGTVSTVGGILGLVHFLVILQPAGVAARDLAKVPAESQLGGSWTKPGTEGQGAPAPGAELYAD